MSLPYSFSTFVCDRPNFDAIWAGRSEKNAQKVAEKNHT